jgi:hypothetical protein
VDGDWTEENIEQNIWDTCYKDEFDMITYCESHEDIQNIIQNGNMYVQVMNVKLIGAVAIQELINGFNDIKDDEKGGLITEEEAWEDLTELVNNKAELRLVYANTNQLICSAEMYYPKTYSEEDCYDQWNGSEYVEVCTTDEWDAPGVYLIFADESKVDAETYFTTGLEDVENAMLDLMEDLEAQYD